MLETEGVLVSEPIDSRSAEGVDLRALYDTLIAPSGVLCTGWVYRVRVANARQRESLAKVVVIIA